MVKNVFSLLILVVLVCALLIAGCAPAPAPAPTPAPKPVETPKPIELKWAIWNPNAGAMKLGVEPWIAEIEKATNGRVKITPYFGESLLKLADAWQGCKSGIADISCAPAPSLPGITPLTEVISIPFLGIKGTVMGTSVLWQLYQKSPEMQKEYASFKVLAINTQVPNMVFAKKKQVKTLEDLQGMKIRTQAGPVADGVTFLGGTPVFMGIGDLYQALEKGVVDGYVTSWEGTATFKLHEQARYLTDLVITIAPMWFIMNLDSWNKLPKDVQGQMDSVIGLKGAERMANAWTKGDEDAIKAIQSSPNKLEVYKLPPDEQARWEKAAGQPLRDKWVADMKAKGLPGQAVLDEAIRLVKEYK
jgi:TRAP-type C4-dicarboxylate transport system substrate-binding protein